MVHLIEAIDALCHSRGAKIMFLAMLYAAGQPARINPTLSEATDWFSAAGIGWQVCATFQSGRVILEGSARLVYIDAPYQPGSLLLQSLETRFELRDSSSSIRGLVPPLLTASEEMVNAERANPAFGTVSTGPITIHPYTTWSQRN